MIEKIIEYFENKVPITEEFKNINVNYLDGDVANYSIEEVAGTPVLEKWITGDTHNQLVFNFTSREYYNQDVLTNMANSNFYEEFRKQIIENNKNKVFPDIVGIDGIECLGSGTIDSVTTDTAKYSIQCRVTYWEEN